MTKILFIALISISSSIFGQNEVAKGILDNLSQTAKSYNNMTIRFDYTFENKSQLIKENQKGKIILEGEKFKLEMDEQTIINNAESQWVYLKDMNEVQIMEHDPEDEMMSPNKLFKIYENGYKFNYILKICLIDRGRVANHAM